MSYEFNWLGVADIISLVGATFFASYVLKANPKSECNRVFALMFFLIGIAGLSGAMWFFSTDLSTMRLWQNICFFSFSPIYGLIVYFTSIFPRKCTIFSKNKYATIVLFVPCFIGWILYLWDRRYLLIAGGGPLPGIWYVITAIGLFYALSVLTRSYFHAIFKIERNQTKYVLSAFTIFGVFSAVYLMIRFFSPFIPYLMFVEVTYALVDILFIILIAYAILKYQLFNIEVKMKTGVKYSIVGAMLSVSFIFFSETMEFFLAEAVGISDSIVSIMAACLLGIIFIPATNFAEKSVNRLFPNVMDTEEHYRFKKLEIYKATLEKALIDSRMGKKEEFMLKSLREKLGISEKYHDKLVAEVKKEIKYKLHPQLTPFP